MLVSKKYIENFMKYKYLLRELVVNEIKVKYRRSVLGIVWSVLHPLMMMVVLTIIFSNIFKGSIPNYAVYILTGRIIWDLYSSSTGYAMTSIVSNAQLIKKIYVPKYIFPLAKCSTTLVNTGFALIALLIVAAVTGVKATAAMFFLPLPILYTFVFAVGVALMMSALNVFFRDLAYLYEVLLTAWMYLTPLFYPASIIPQKYMIYMEMNPIYQFLDMFRNITMYGHIPGLRQNLICLSISIVSLIIGLFVFYKKQDRFILYV